MVRIKPPLPITTPVPSRSAPSVAALRASGSARALTATIAAKNASGSIDEVSPRGGSAALAATDASNAANRHPRSDRKKAHIKMRRECIASSCAATANVATDCASGQATIARLGGAENASPGVVPAARLTWCDCRYNAVRVLVAAPKKDYRNGWQRPQPRVGNT